MGVSTEASGKNSTAMGIHAHAKHQASFVMGTITNVEDCESKAEGEFRACINDVVFEIDGKEISVKKIAQALCNLGEQDFCQFFSLILFNQNVYKQTTFFSNT